MESQGLSTWRGRRVLVTGHTGFKGGWLSLWLARLGAEVTGGSLGVPTEPSLYELARVRETLAGEVEVDIRDRRALKQAVAEAAPEVVFHLAAQPLVRRAYSEPAETFEINTLGTANLLEAVRETAGVEAVVVATTDKVYAERDGQPHREADRLGGADPYSASKAAAELLVDAFRRSFFAAPGTANVATARAGNVIGGGDFGAERLVPDLVRAAGGGDPVQLRNPAAVRPWQHVLNPLSGYLVLGERLWRSGDAEGGWNFGPAAEDERPVAWVAERFAELWDGAPAWRAAPGEHPREAPALRLDSAKARRELGWEPRWDLERGLAEVVAWHRRVEAGADARAVTLEQIESFERA